MPVIKRQKNLTELLNNAVQQQNSILESTSDLVHRPASIWNGQYKNEDGQALRLDIIMRGGSTSFWEFLARIENKIIDFCMDDRWIPLCRYCTLLNINRVIRGLRLPVALVAVIILMYEAPKSEYIVRDSYDLTAVCVDIVLNVAFLCGAVVRALSIPMEVRVAHAFERQVHMRDLMFSSGGLRDIPVIILCFALGISTEGMWLRLILLMSLTPSLLEAVPQISILLGSITGALGSIATTIALYFMAIAVYASFGHSLFKNNDPFHFGTYGISCWTFFRFGAMDAWAEIWNLNYTGCDKFPSGDIDQNNHAPAAIFTQFGTFREGACTNPEALPISSTVVFVSFLFLCAYLLVNTVMAAVVIGIKGGLDAYKSMTIFGVDKKIDILEVKTPGGQNSSGRKPGTGDPSSVSVANDKILKMTGGKKDAQALAQAVYRIWAGNDGMSHKNETVESQYGEWTEKTRIAYEFDTWMNSESYSLLFLSLSLLVALVEVLTEMAYTSHDDVFVLNCVCQIIFTVEFGLRTFTYTERPPKQKWKWGWLIFGASLTIVLWVPLVAAEKYDVLNSCQMLRLVGGLQFLSWIKDLEMIMTAFTVSCYGIVLLGWLVMIAFFFFAVMAVMLFKETDPYRFGSIPSSLSALIQLLTYDSLDLVVRTSMLGCANFGYDTGIEVFDSTCCASSVGMGWAAPIFFACFCIVCSLILMSALIGLIISSMENLMEIKHSEVEIWKDVEEVVRAYEIPACTIPWTLTLFEMLDKDENCHLTFPQLTQTMRAAGMAEEPDQFEIFLKVDRDGSGQIEFPEFCELLAILGLVLNKTAFAKKKALEAIEEEKMAKFCREVEESQNRTAPRKNSAIPVVSTHDVAPSAVKKSTDRRHSRHHGKKAREKTAADLVRKTSGKNRGSRYEPIESEDDESVSIYPSRMELSASRMEINPSSFDDVDPFVDDKNVKVKTRRRTSSATPNVDMITEMAEEGEKSSIVDNIADMVGRGSKRIAPISVPEGGCSGEVNPPFTVSDIRAVENGKTLSVSAQELEMQDL